MLKERGEVAPFVWVWDLQIIIFFFFTNLPVQSPWCLLVVFFCLVSLCLIQGACELPAGCQASQACPGKCLDKGKMEKKGAVRGSVWHRVLFIGFCVALITMAATKVGAGGCGEMPRMFLGKHV